MRFILTAPNSSRPVVIVETHAQITQQSTDNLRTLMYERSCANGMLFDPANCVALRDTYQDMGVQSIQVDLRLATEDVLQLVRGSGLDARVETWLALLSTSWSHALPQDASVAALLYDFVPAAVGTTIQIAGDAQ
jgi:hypothetical protein